MDIETLLFEEESTSLDFKREAYKFSGVNDHQKSELLKDILAFANAWRRNTAYILLGVEEVKGGRSTPVGITDELDDAQLQEFVNQKTQRPIDFIYKTILVDELKIGVIEIPTQQRPIYLTKKYANLTRNTVYIRRGSSTAEAPPDEIVKMAEAEIKNAIKTPSLRLLLSNLDSKQILGSETTITPTILDMSRFGDISDFKEPEHPHARMLGISSQLFGRDARPQYYRELAFYEFTHQRTEKISFVVANTSQTTATDITINIIFEKNESKYSILLPSELPELPKSHNESLLLSPPLITPSFADKLIKKDSTFEVEELDDTIEVNLTLRKVQAKQTIFCERSICISANDSFTLTPKVTIFADGLPKPIKTEIIITCNAKHQTKAFKGLDEKTTTSGLTLGKLIVKKRE